MTTLKIKQIHAEYEVRKLLVGKVQAHQERVEKILKANAEKVQNINYRYRWLKQLEMGLHLYNTEYNMSLIIADLPVECQSLEKQMLQDNHNHDQYHGMKNLKEAYHPLPSCM